MKKLYLLLALICTMLPIGVTEAQQLAFPGADGYGKHTTGGRGGEVYYVTRTDDCSDNDLVEGTLRWALRHDNGGKPRTILFATSGTIYLTSKLKFAHPDVSILGQTAPGGGITITGYPLNITANNVIIRYVRFRAGDIPDKSFTGLDMENCDNVILDHCSMTWSMEECLTAYDTDYTTVQWCIIGESLYNSKNSKGGRAYAMQWGGEHSTMHHTLITNSMSRAPRFNGVRNVSTNPGDHDQKVDSEFANNVMFNCKSSYGGENNPDCKGYNRVYMINNYWRPGPATANRYFTSPSTPYGEWYLNGNMFEKSSKYAPSTTAWSDAEIEKVNNDNYYGTVEGNSSRGIDITGTNAETYLLKELPYALSGMEYEAADEAYRNVTTKAGASLPRYDEVDSRLLAEAAGTADPKYKGGNNSLGIIDSPDDITLSYSDTYVANGTTYNNMPRMFIEGQDKYMVDSDADGMPDGYEDEMGFDKNDAADGAATASNGYTNLENYLNGVADGTIDKTKYETSSVYVEPGPEVVPPENVTAVFSVSDKNVEGTVPASITAAYGETITIPVNTSLYKEGYTLTNWTCEGKVYTPGQEVTLNKETNTLTPVFTANKVNIGDRITDVTVSWNFGESAPEFTGSGIYVTQSNFSGADHDVKLSWSASVITLPACAGATINIETADGTENFEATADTYEYDATGKQIKGITVTLPYIWNTGDRVYHEPEIPVGYNYELFYTTPDNANAAEWISGTYWEYTQNRTFYDPEKDDNTTYYYGTAVVVNNSDQTLDMFVTGTEKVRLFISSQSSNPDYGILTATSSDGTDVKTVKSGLLAKKQTPDIIEMALDKTKEYRLQVYTENDYQISVGAIKLYGDEPVVTEGDANVSWAWAGTPTANGVKVPSTMFTTATAGFDDAAFTQKSNTAFGETFVSFTPKCGICHDTRDAQDVVTFDIQPATGVYFLPQNISFHAVKFGTGHGKVDVTVQQGDGDETVVLENSSLTRNNESSLNAHSIDLSAFSGITSSSELLKVRIYIYDVFFNEDGVGKEIGLNNITVSGKYNGTPPEVKKYTFTATATPADAALVSWTPSGSTFDEGTEINVTSTLKGNYLFENWTDGSGNVVSTKENFTYTIKGNTELTANYKSYSDYGHIFDDAAPYDAAVKTINELKVALATAAERADKTARYRIFLHNGTYDYGTSAKNAVPGMVSLIGESQDGVIIMNCPEKVSTPADDTPTLFIDRNEHDVYMQDLTVRQGRDWEAQASQVQAMAVRQRGKRAVYKNVTLQGIQDTYYMNAGDATAYFETSTVAGQTDYIYGDGTAWFEQCTLYNTGAGYITAPNTQSGYTGMVFNECTVDGAASAAGGFCLGRPWNDSPSATFLNTTFKQLPTDAGWGKMTDGLVIRFHEYGSVDANGTPLDLSTRSIEACNAATGSDNPVLTAEEAKAYTVESVLGTDWNPQSMAQQLTAPAISIDGNNLSWAAVTGALGYAIVKDGSVVGFATGTTFDISLTGAGRYSIRVANECGGLGAESSSVSGISGIIADGESNADAPKYNVAGQRVGTTFKGIVIQNGKKYVKK